MIARKLLSAAIVLLSVVFTFGCKDNEAEYISLNVENKDISVGEEYQFFLSVQGLNGSEYTGSVRWSVETSDETKSTKGSDYIVASVDNFGKVKGLKQGTAYVKAVLENGRYARARLYVGERTVSESVVTVSRDQIYMKRDFQDTLSITLDEAYRDAQKYPIEVYMNLSADDGSASATKSKTKAKITSQEEPGRYLITFYSGDVKESCICTVKVGSYTKEIPVEVDFSLYLSFNTIDPTNPGDNPGLEKPLDFSLNGKQTLSINFFVSDDDPQTTSYERVKAALINTANYSVSGDIALVVGTPDIQRGATTGLYVMNIEITVGNIAGSGTFQVSVFGKTVKANISVDDGMKYKAIYISFDEVNSYVLPPQGLVMTTSQTVDVSKAGSTPNTFKIPVFYYIDPDDRGAYIDWNIVQAGDPVIIPMGSQVVNTKRTDFEFAVGNNTGSATVTFKVYNPQGELGGDYAQYLNQAITATITVQDKETIIVESVTFETAETVTNAKEVPLTASVLPITAAGVWPPVFTIEQLLNGAKATVNSSTGAVSITHAGTIKVKASSGGVGKEKTDTHTIIAKFWLDGGYPKPLEITAGPRSMNVGETATVTTLLHSNYAINPEEYSWKSSNPSVVSVDGGGNLTARAEGNARITVTVKDDYDVYAADIRDITVKTVNADVNFNDSHYVAYSVIYGSDPTTMYVDTDEGAEDYVEFTLSKAIQSDGVYLVGSDFTGTVTLNPEGNEFSLVTGTITISGGNMIFNLTISNGTIYGSITGTKPIS